jgi:hypothetical protein
MTETIVVRDELYDSYDTYWSVGHRKTYCKPEALLWANGDHNKVSFHWMERTWDRVDFTVEPEMSWQTMSEFRARQIRQQHSWVCLWFSGGYDSMHMLQSFIDSNSLIDEIAIIDWSSYYDDGEVHTAKKIADQYRIFHNPKVRITIVETDWNCFHQWYQDRPNWLTTSPGDTIRFTRPNLYARMHMNNTMRSRLEAELNRADVTGFEKPRMNIYNGQWRTFMPDSLMSNAVASGTVQFYCTQDFPEFHVKQVYLAMKFFEDHNLANNDSVNAIQSYQKVNNQDWFQAHSLGVGRCLPINPASQTSRDKLSGSPSLNSIKDRKIIEHAKKTQDKSFKIFMEGVNTLQEALPLWDPYSSNYSQYVKCSKFISVRPVKVYP